MDEPVGILPVDKPEGPTSHDVVAAARRAIGVRRIGHTGTLDPFASGLLLLCIGRATRLAQYLGGLGKTYLAGMRLGVETDTEDATGTVLAHTGDWSRTTEAEVRAAFDGHVGEIDQVPPVYSAKKIEGRRAHRLARSGSPPELAPVRVRVESIRITRFDPPDVDFEITCGTGTYIRSIARDVGRRLGVGAHLTRLRRTCIDTFRVESAVSMAALADPETVAAAWIEPIAAVRHLPSVTLSAEQIREVAHGAAVPAPDAMTLRGPVAMVAEGRLIAIGEPRGDRIQPRKVLA